MNVAEGIKLRLAHLYPQAMNIYGDRGNVLSLMRRAQWRGIAIELVSIDKGSPRADWWDCDIYFMGGGQDAQQIAIQEDLFRHKSELLKRAAENKSVFLTICGGYQLLGHYYKPHEGPELKGLGLIDAYTVAGSTRFIGNVVAERSCSDGTLQSLVGFENHSGLTYLGDGVQPLATVITGKGNNGQDGGEGIQQGNLFGTYLHGSLLPKNPALADELLLRALQRHLPSLFSLPPLEDTFETLAHKKAKTLTR